MANEKLEIIINAKDNASRVLGGVGKALKDIKVLGLGAAAAGIGAVGLGLGKAASIGLGFNNTLEEVTAQLNAFTKDGAESARILETIRDRAARTPFQFEEMARATASLLPAAKASGAELENLIQLSEILAASNPAQGLEGAAFSLREALSGDFVSIIERFNLPRNRLNQLKDEGVPALEAISQAMEEMGLDSELVTNLSQTASGRLSTLKDTLTGLAATATQPLFNLLSDSLGQLNAKLEIAAPTFQNFITDLIAGDKITAIKDLQQALLQLGFPPETVGNISESVTNIIDSLGSLQGAFSGITFEDVANAVSTLIDVFEGLAWTIQKTNEAIQIGIGLYEQFKTITGEIGIEGLLNSLPGSSALGAINPLAGIYAASGALNQATGSSPQGGPIPQTPVNNNIQVPVTLEVDGNVLARTVGYQQGNIFRNYAAVGGIANQ